MSDESIIRIAWRACMEWARPLEFALMAVVGAFVLNQVGWAMFVLSIAVFGTVLFGFQALAYLWKTSHGPRP